MNQDIDIKPIVCFYIFMLIPLLFWWSWQFSSILAWLSVIACCFLAGFPYRDALRAEWTELKKHTKKGSLGDWFGVKFGDKTFQTLLFLIVYLIPNFFSFWMYLSKGNLPFWICFALFPLVFVAIKQNSGVMDSNRAIGINSSLVAFFPSVALALIETFWELIIGSSKMNAQAGADFVFDNFSAFFHWWSSIIDGFFSFIFSWLPWTEFWVVLISNFLVYFGVFFTLSLMFRSGGKISINDNGGMSACLKTLRRLLRRIQVLLCLIIFGLLMIFAIIEKENKESSAKDNQQKIENLERGVAEILGKNFKNTIGLSKFANSNPDDIRCGWITQIFFASKCEILNSVADQIEKIQKENRGE